MGLRSAIIRYVSKAVAQDKPEDATSTIAAALWVRLLISAGVAVLSVILAIVFPHLFKIPPDLQRAAQITVLMCALGIGFTLVSGVFGGVLSATHRFDILSSISALQTLARAVGVILILKTGHGLVGLACWELAIGILGGLGIFGMAWKTFPLCRVKTLRPDVPVLKKIWSYSLTTFVFIIAVQIVTNTDNLVIGAFVGVQMVAFYAIGGSLMDYSWRVVSAVSTTFTPIASNLEAAGKGEDLRRFLLRGTQATLAIAIPISWALALRGKTFISLWMGPQFSEIAGNVLQILMICQFLGVANGTAGSVMMAIDKHKPVAKWAIIEAVLNFTCSIILVKTIGLYGVAWGTTVALTFVHLYFWPSYVRKVLEIPIHTYIVQGWLKMAACSVPYALLLAITDRYWHAGNLLSFFGQIAAVLPAFFLCVAVVFRSEVRGLFLRWQASRLVQA